MKALIFLLLAASLYAQSLGGTYQGDGVRLVLEERAGGNVAGRLEFEGQSYPVTARVVAGKLTGSFTTNGGSFPIEATLSGGLLQLTSGGTTYRLSGSQMHRNAAGFNLQLPAGWTAAEKPEGSLLLPPGVNYDPNRNDNPEIYIAMAKDGYSPAEEATFAKQLSSAFTQGGGQVTRAGVRESLNYGGRPGMVYRWDVRDPRLGRTLAFDLFGIPEGNRIFVLISVGDATRVRPREAEVRQMLGSMRVETPKPLAPGPLSDSTPLAQQWLAKLKGKLVRQFHNYSGMSSEKFHYLNADGTYVYKSTSMVSVDVAGASGMSAGSNANTGRWRIREQGGELALEVRFNNGETRLMPITQEGRNWYLNGEKAFAVEQ
jgi:hypothetical protein